MRMAIMAMTTSNSIRVNPGRVRRRMRTCMGGLLARTDGQWNLERTKTVLRGVTGRCRDTLGWESSSSEGRARGVERERVADAAPRSTFRLLHKHRRACKHNLDFSH